MNAKSIRKGRAFSSILMTLTFVLLGCNDEGTMKSTQKEAPMDIVDTAIAAEDFNTLVTAVKAAELVSTLKSPGPFTVFAPTDAAFAKLPADTLSNLLQPENKEKLTSILTYHVVPGQVMAADVLKLSSAKTVNGQSLSVKTGGGVVMVDNATVVQTDIQCSNGVIHVIDAVVMPN